MINEIRLGRKKLYVIAEGETIFVLADCDVTGGMLRIPMTLAQFERWQKPRKEREMIQDIFPELLPDLREVLISGETPAEWRRLFGNGQYTKKELVEKFHYEFEN